MGGGGGGKGGCRDRICVHVCCDSEGSKYLISNS